MSDPAQFSEWKWNFAHYRIKHLFWASLLSMGSVHLSPPPQPPTSLFLKIFLDVYILQVWMFYLHVCLSTMCVCAWCPPRSEGGSDSLELQLGMIVNHCVMLGAEFRSSARVTSAHKC